MKIRFNLMFLNPELPEGKRSNLVTGCLASGEVLSEDGEQIEGLYAAGRNSCGIARSAEGYASGTCIGDATFFGRLAGRAAASRRPAPDA